MPTHMNGQVCEPQFAQFTITGNADTHHSSHYADSSEVRIL